MSIQGWAVLVPRPAGRAAELASALTAAGAAPEMVPFIETRPLPESGAVRDALKNLADGEYGWLIVTSAAAVDALQAAGGRIHVPAQTRVAAVGATTVDALAGAGIAVDLVPSGAGSAATLVAAWPRGEPPTRILLPRSDRARPALPAALREWGYIVDDVVAYRTEILAVPASAARRLADGDIKAVVCTSPSVVASLARVPVAASVRLIAIGPSTAAALREAGLRVAATAAEPSPQALIAALQSVAGADRM